MQHGDTIQQGHHFQHVTNSNQHSHGASIQLHPDTQPRYTFNHVSSSSQTTSRINGNLYQPRTQDVQTQTSTLPHTPSSVPALNTNQQMQAAAAWKESLGSQLAMVEAYEMALRFQQNGGLRMPPPVATTSTIQFPPPPTRGFTNSTVSTSYVQDQRTFQGNVSYGASQVQGGEFRGAGVTVNQGGFDGGMSNGSGWIQGYMDGFTSTQPVASGSRPAPTHSQVPSTTHVSSSFGPFPSQQANNVASPLPHFPPARIHAVKSPEPLPVRPWNGNHSRGQVEPGRTPTQGSNYLQNSQTYQQPAFDGQSYVTHSLAGPSNPVTQVPMSTPTLDMDEVEVKIESGDQISHVRPGNPGEAVVPQDETGTQGNAAVSMNAIPDPTSPDLASQTRSDPSHSDNPIQSAALERLQAFERTARSRNHPPWEYMSTRILTLATQGLEFDATKWLAVLEDTGRKDIFERVVTLMLEKDREMTWRLIRRLSEGGGRTIPEPAAPVASTSNPVDGPAIPASGLTDNTPNLDTSAAQALPESPSNQPSSPPIQTSIIRPPMPCVINSDLPPPPKPSAPSGPMAILARWRRIAASTALPPCRIGMPTLALGERDARRLSYFAMRINQALNNSRQRTSVGLSPFADDPIGKLESAFIKRVAASAKSQGLDIQSFVTTQAQPRASFDPIASLGSRKGKGKGKAVEVVPQDEGPPGKSYPAKALLASLGIVPLQPSDGRQQLPPSPETPGLESNGNDGNGGFGGVVAGDEHGAEKGDGITSTEDIKPDISAGQDNDEVPSHNVDVDMDNANGEGERGVGWDEDIKPDISHGLALAASGPPRTVTTSSRGTSFGGMDIDGAIAPSQPGPSNHSNSLQLLPPSNTVVTSDFNPKLLRSLPVDRCWVDVPHREATPPPVAKPYELKPPKHQYYNPEDLPDRFDKPSDMLWLQPDVVWRLSARPCGWPGCDTIAASEGHLLRHVKKRDHANEGLIVKRHPLEKDAYVCSWTTCPTPLYRSKRKLLQHIIAAHVCKDLECPFREGGFNSPPCGRFCSSLSSIERHVTRTHPNVLSRVLLPITTFNADSYGQPPPRRIPDVPLALPSASVFPYVTFPSVWTNSTRKYNAILAVQDNCFIDREEPRMSSGRSPQSMAVPIPLPLVVDKLGEEAGIPVAPGDELLVEGKIIDVDVVGQADASEVELEMSVNIKSESSESESGADGSWAGPSRTTAETRSNSWMDRMVTPPPRSGSRLKLEVLVEVPSPLKIAVDKEPEPPAIPSRGRRLARRAAIHPAGELFRGMRSMRRDQRTGASVIMSDDRDEEDAPRSALAGTVAGAAGSRAVKRKMAAAFEVEILLERPFFSGKKQK